MTSIFSRLRIAMLALLASTLLVVGTAGAASNLYNGVDCSGKAASSTFCSDKGATGNPLTGKDGIILTATKIIAVIAGVAAVIVIMLAGFRYITSSGDSGEMAKARHTLLYAIAGLVVIALAPTIVGFVLSKIAN